MRPRNRSELKALWVSVLQGQGLDNETTMEILEELMDHVPEIDKPLVHARDGQNRDNWISPKPLEVK